MDQDPYDPKWPSHWDQQPSRFPKWVVRLAQAAKSVAALYLAHRKLIKTAAAVICFCIFIGWVPVPDVLGIALMLLAPPLYLWDSLVHSYGWPTWKALEPLQWLTCIMWMLLLPIIVGMGFAGSANVFRDLLVLALIVDGLFGWMRPFVDAFLTYDHRDRKK